MGLRRGGVVVVGVSRGGGQLVAPRFSSGSRVSRS